MFLYPYLNPFENHDVMSHIGPKLTFRASNGKNFAFQLRSSLLQPNNISWGHFNVTNTYRRE